MTTLHAEGQLYAFLRHDDTDRLLVLMNAGDDEVPMRLPVASEFPNGTTMQSVFGPTCLAAVDDGHLRWNVPARSATVLTPAG